MRRVRDGLKFVVSPDIVVDWAQINNNELTKMPRALVYPQTQPGEQHVLSMVYGLCSLGTCFEFLITPKHAVQTNYTQFINTCRKTAKS